MARQNPWHPDNHCSLVLETPNSIQYLYKYRNTAYQDELIEQFIQTLGAYPVGTLVELSGGAKAVFCAAMVLGRLETLASIALLTPDLWRG